MEKNVKPLTGAQKFWCTIAGMSNVVLAYTLYWVFKEDNDERHVEFAKYQLLGGRISLFGGIALAVLGLFVGFFTGN